MSKKTEFEKGEKYSAQKNLLIVGVSVKELKYKVDERGRLMEIFRHDDVSFKKFGQVYITTAYPGVVKAWHYHKKQFDNFAVVKGMLKLVLFDPRKNSLSHGIINEFFIGDYNTILVTVPPYIYHGFKCISENEAILLNCASESYNHSNPDEFRLPPHTKEIPYDWTRKDG